MSDHKFNVTLKAAADYGAPWLTVGSDDPNELHNALAAFAGVAPNVDTAGVIVAAATKLQNFWTAKDTLGGQVVSQQPQQGFTAQQQASVQQYQQSATQVAPVGPATQLISGQAQQPQAAPPQQPAPTQGPGPSCQHGPMVWKEGVGQKSQKPYKGWFCQTQGSNCSPQFVR